MHMLARGRGWSLVAILAVGLSCGKSGNVTSEKRIGSGPQILSCDSSQSNCTSVLPTLRPGTDDEYVFTLDPLDGIVALTWSIVGGAASIAYDDGEFVGITPGPCYGGPTATLTVHYTLEDDPEKVYEESVTLFYQPPDVLLNIAFQHQDPLTGETVAGLPTGMGLGGQVHVTGSCGLNSMVRLSETLTVSPGTVELEIMEVTKNDESSWVSTVWAPASVLACILEECADVSLQEPGQAFSEFSGEIGYVSAGVMIRPFQKAEGWVEFSVLAPSTELNVTITYTRVPRIGVFYAALNSSPQMVYAFGGDGGEASYYAGGQHQPLSIGGTQVEVNGAGYETLASVVALASDSNNNLYVANNDSAALSVAIFSRWNLSDVPDAGIVGAGENNGSLAFDSFGNLWLGTDPYQGSAALRVLRQQTLLALFSTGPGTFVSSQDVTTYIVALEDPSGNPLDPQVGPIAFDEMGNLYGIVPGDRFFGFAASAVQSALQAAQSSPSPPSLPATFEVNGLSPTGLAYQGGAGIAVTGDSLEGAMVAFFTVGEIKNAFAMGGSLSMGSELHAVMVYPHDSLGHLLHEVSGLAWTDHNGLLVAAGDSVALVPPYAFAVSGPVKVQVITSLARYQDPRREGSGGWPAAVTALLRGTYTQHH